jgi:hypothetical protein
MNNKTNNRKINNKMVRIKKIIVCNNSNNNMLKILNKNKKII